MENYHQDIEVDQNPEEQHGNEERSDAENQSIGARIADVSGRVSTGAEQTGDVFAVDAVGEQRRDEYISFDEFGRRVESGENVSQLVDKLAPQDILKNLDALTDRGAQIDINELITRSPASWIDRAELPSLSDDEYQWRCFRFRSEIISESISHLTYNGADVQAIVSVLTAEDQISHISELQGNGAQIDVNELISLSPRSDDKEGRGYLNLEHRSAIVSNDIDSLIRAGADIQTIVGALTPRDMANCIYELREHSAKIDGQWLYESIAPNKAIDISECLEYYGANIDYDSLASKLSRQEVEDHFEILARKGVDIDSLVGIMRPRGFRTKHIYGYAALRERKFVELVAQLKREMASGESDDGRLEKEISNALADLPSDYESVVTPEGLILAEVGRDQSAYFEDDDDD